MNGRGRGRMICGEDYEAGLGFAWSEVGVDRGKNSGGGT